MILRKRKDIRLDVVQACRTFKTNAKTTDDLVEQQQNAPSRVQMRRTSRKNSGS